MSDKAKVLADQALKDLAAQLAAGRSESLLKLLEVMGNFHRYSLGNQLLISFQKPDATRVAGFQAWLKLKRCVKKGEKGIAILAPCISRGKKGETEAEEGDSEAASKPARERIFFKTVYVFDVSQTDGEELPGLAQITGEPGELLAALEALVRAEGIALSYANFPGTAEGYSKVGEIVIREGLGAAESFAVLAHELAHEWLHDKEKRRAGLSKQVAETEAEAVAYAVCRAVGLDCFTRSSDYIQLYAGDVETLGKSLAAIQGAASRMIGALTEEAPANDMQGLDGKPVEAGELVAA